MVFLRELFLPSLLPFCCHRHFVIIHTWLSSLCCCYRYFVIIVILLLSLICCHRYSVSSIFYCDLSSLSCYRRYFIVICRNFFCYRRYVVLLFRCCSFMHVDRYKNQSRCVNIWKHWNRHTKLETKEAETWV